MSTHSAVELTLAQAVERDRPEVGTIVLDVYGEHTDLIVELPPRESSSRLDPEA